MARTPRIEVAERNPGSALPPPPPVNASTPRLLGARERAMLHGLSLCCRATIRRWELGLTIQPASRERLEQAAATLGLIR
jgi:hypothetical protein